MLGQEAYLVELDKLRFPIINFRRTAYFGLSVVNFWAIAMGTYMVAAPMMSWIDYESPSLSVFFWFAGLCAYIIGFYDWYQGRTMLSFFDFIFGLLFLVIYFTAELGKYGIWVPYYYYTYMQGTFYTIFLVLLLIVLISLKDRGCIYLCNIFLIALGLIFVIIWEFSKRLWARKVAGYILFIAAISLFYTGLGRFVCETYQCTTFPLVHPYW